MPQSQSPIEVSASTAPVAAAARYLLVMAGTFAVAKGWVKAENVEGIATAALTIGTALYGLWRTHRNKADLVTAAEAAPDRVAKVVP